MKTFDKPLAFIDTETTGLDPSIHEIIEIAIIKDPPLSEKDPAKRAVSERWTTIVRPKNMSAADPAAMLINRLTEEELESDEAMLFEDLAVDVNKALFGCVIIGKNVAFDLAFLQSAFKRARRDTGIDLFIEFDNRHYVDITSLAFTHLVPLGLESLSLQAICKFLDIENDEEHRALGDAAATRACFYRLHKWSPLTDVEKDAIFETTAEYVLRVSEAGFGSVSIDEAMAAMAYEVLRDPGVMWLKEITGKGERGVANKWQQAVMLLRSTRVTE
jgi:DNA polymerase III epsilon subunit-like protein